MTPTNLTPLDTLTPSLSATLTPCHHHDQVKRHKVKSDSPEPVGMADDPDTQVISGENILLVILATSAETVSDTGHCLHLSSRWTAAGA